MLQKTAFSFFICFFFIGLFTAKVQLGISYHQSALPFVSINYTFAKRLMPELRLGTDRYLEDVSVEGVLTYQYLQREDYSLYAGLGFFYDDFGSASVPLGLLVFPFENKSFGFHMEATPLIGEGINIFRGSWGIRYRFTKE
jgi:hypothetical protein